MRRSLVALALLAFAGSAMGQESCSSTTTGGDEAQVEKGSSRSGKKRAKQAQAAEVGDKVTLKGTTYRVSSVKTAKTIGDNEYTRTKANGMFVIVKMSLTNRKDEPATILADNIRLVGGNGKNYSTSDDALFALDDQNFILEEIQPDNTERGTMVYDVPKAAVSGAKLQVSDLFSDAKADINLGL